MAEIPAQPLAAAARDLMLAGRWDQATVLLSSGSGANDAERAVLAVAEAEVAVDQDFWCRTGRGSCPARRRICCSPTTWSFSGSGTTTPRSCSDRTPAFRGSGRTGGRRRL